MAIQQLKLLNIIIPKEWMEEAHHYKKAFDIRKLESGFQTSRFDAETDYKGRVGERIFDWFLSKELSLSTDTYDWLNKESDQKKPYDFILHTNKGDITIDVKTAGTNNSFNNCKENISTWSYNYPVSSKPSEKDLIILIYLWESNKECCIVGFIEGYTVAKCEIKNCAVDRAKNEYKLPNHKISPIGELFHDIEGLSVFCGL